MYDKNIMDTAKYIINNVKNKIVNDKIGEVRVIQEDDKFIVELYNLISDEYDERCEIIKLPKKNYNFIEIEFSSLTPNDRFINYKFIKTQ